MRTLPHNVLSLLVVMSAVGSRAGAQVAGEADPRSARLNRTMYFADSTTEARDRAALGARTAGLVGSIAAADAASLVNQLTAADQTLVSLQRHVAYLKVATLEDVDDQGAKDALASVTADQSHLNGAIQSRLRRESASDIDALGPFAKYARDVRREGEHELAPEAVDYRATVVARTEHAIADAYDRQSARLRGFPGMGSPDAGVRRPALARRTAMFDTAAPVEAALLAALVDLENRDAVAHRFRNAAVQKYASLGLSETAVSRTLAAVVSQASSYRRYQQLVADRAAKRLGISPIMAAERNVGAPRQPSLPFAQARELVLSALAPLGADYVRRFDALLDPAAGRLDLSGGAHRANTGTSIVAYDAPVALYVTSYSGTLGSLSLLVHEGGHAINFELMNARGLPAYLRHGPHSLYEGYALFNELLLLDQAARTAETPDARAQALEAFLETMSHEVFTSAAETAFEKTLYETANGGPLLSRERIDSLYRASTAPYAYWPMSDVGTSEGWMSKPLLFEDPLYLVNYLYASLVGVALYERAHADPDFARKYDALLSRGFDADPATLLATVGITLEDRGLIQRAVALFSAKTDELEAVYAARGDRPPPSP